MSNNVCIDQYRQRRYTFLTVVGLAVLLGAFFVAYGASDGPTTPAPATLKLLHIIFRHGDRTPVYSYANDPYRDHQWEGGKGALTNKGKAEIYELGQIMRIRYGNFLNEAYDPEEIYMESSYAPRCQMSAQMFLAAMYPPKGRQIWNLNLLWQPIPANPVPRDLDNVSKHFLKKYNLF
ncbi:unnamed protein product [Nesidiocoris tenuis]|uniref:Lysosomal acid phosphatase n=1 Tax=Nesidiocoris tenuis TaxID=355587 RepID=A0A6H5HML4_9HEMI|nr:unnamed protein product [Nesidiocoris tenuis]